MPVRLTEELKAQALAVARLYQPLREPLLVGSCVWLGEGNDIDVVVLVHNSTWLRGGVPCGHVEYNGMNSYRHGNINVIAVEDERIWAGWVHAAEVMPIVPRELLKEKKLRVKVCETLRVHGEKQCQSV